MTPTPEILKTNPPRPPTAEELRGNKGSDKANEPKSCANCNFSEDYNNYFSPCRKCIHTNNNPFPNWESIPKQTQYEKLMADMTALAKEFIYECGHFFGTLHTNSYFDTYEEALQAEIAWLNSKVGQ